MSGIFSSIQAELRSKALPEKAKVLPRFFKTGQGDYGEGDKFLGVAVPAQRAIANQYWKQAEEYDISRLLDSPFHEERLTGLFILVARFKADRKKDPENDNWVKLYIRKMDRVNNWDLVDSSAPQILGQWLEDRDRSLLYKLARSKDLWKNRIAMVSTQHFIRNNDLDDLEKLAEILLPHEHDLIHKAVGWMLREGWQKDPIRIEKWLKRFKTKMSRTMLRYAIEKMEEKKRKTFLER